MDDSLLQYFNHRGQASPQEVVVQFLTYYSKIPALLDAENVTVRSGCCSVFSALTLALCDTGEAFPTLTPSMLVSPIHLASEITDVDIHLFQLTGQVGESHA